MANSTIQALREAIRYRVVPLIVPQKKYQREGLPAPDAKEYIRETIVSLDKVEDFQGSTKEQYLIQFDVYARRDAYQKNVVDVLYGYAQQLCDEFNPRTAEKQYIQISGSIAYVDRLPALQSISQEGELFCVPVLVYITVINAR